MNTIDPKHNRRSYAAREYYAPNADRPNLFLLTHALVSKIELEKNADTVKATGVQFSHSGATHVVKAKREVIVCGGAINSPQILELSGIGSPTVLQKAGVDTIVDLPGVGDNLSDHTATGIVLVSNIHHPNQIISAENSRALKMNTPREKFSATQPSSSKPSKPTSTTKPGPLPAPPQQQASPLFPKSHPNSPMQKLTSSLSSKTTPATTLAPTRRVATPYSRASSSTPKKQSVKS